PWPGRPGFVGCLRAQRTPGWHRSQPWTRPLVLEFAGRARRGYYDIALRVLQTIGGRRTIMTIITYRVTLLEPTLVTSLQGDPNSGVAFDYLPGSVLRGAFIGKYLGSKSADTGKNTLRRLFFDGTTRYLNGYPLDVYHHPSTPTPL